jgi:hypothetical protein
MDIVAFKDSLSMAPPPPGLSAALEALWLDGKGDWSGAHDRLQEDHSAAGSWVHAYLHRKEGDLANAGYWYRKAGQPTAQGSLEQEWDTLAQTLLASP